MSEITSEFNYKTIKVLINDHFCRDFRKIDDPQKRYETFGYCKMFHRMLNIEDLTVRKALDDLIMHNKVIGKVPNFSGRFTVQVRISD